MTAAEVRYAMYLVIRGRQSESDAWTDAVTDLATLRDRWANRRGWVRR